MLLVMVLLIAAGEKTRKYFPGKMGLNHFPFSYVIPILLLLKLFLDKVVRRQYRAEVGAYSRQLGH